MNYFILLLSVFAFSSMYCVGNTSEGNTEHPLLHYLANASTHAQYTKIDHPLTQNFPVKTSTLSLRLETTFKHTMYPHPVKSQAIPQTTNAPKGSPLPQTVDSSLLCTLQLTRINSTPTEGIESVKSVQPTRPHAKKQKQELGTFAGVSRFFVPILIFVPSLLYFSAMYIPFLARLKYRLEETTLVSAVQHLRPTVAHTDRQREPVTAYETSRE